ncbi:acyltransferase [Kangiella taiwanensis]|uniref:Acyltransferase n=1 Tax=Kangiella taiwanensis TaxID=1079179 RepID=A0ABP8I0Q1_9GAMM|nr:acyltransferase [Kangiella taiwanensis]
MFSFIIHLYLKLRFGKRLVIGKKVVFKSLPTLIISKDSSIVLSEEVIIGKMVELRATRGSTLILGKFVKLDTLVRVIATNKADIVIGDFTRVGIGSVFNGGGKINIGNNTLISGYVYIQTSMHNYLGDDKIQNQGYSYGDIIIGDDSWIGVHAVIFPDVVLGEKVIVGSNSVVNKSFSKHCVIAGAPAERIRILKQK